MDKPKIASLGPVVLELDAGKYAYCTCGLAAEQPFCDGAHAGTEFKPQIFEIAESTRVALCPCKQTKEPPHCDGAHKLFNLDD